MTPRAHRRRARDEMLAPWIAGAVILGSWGLAARFIVREPAPSEASPRPALSAPATAAERPPNEAVGTSGEPAPAAAERPDAPAAHEPLDPDPPAPLPAIPLDANTVLDVEVLRQRQLTLPVAGVQRGALVPSFDDTRSGGRVHEALDILAPRRTPVIAAEAGTIAKLFTSRLGGLTIYQFDPSGTYCYYYGHLDAYAPGLVEGTPVERGQTIGYVGTTGNAPPDTPHLHFAIFRMGPERQWWEGVPIDPYLVLR